VEKQVLPASYLDADKFETCCDKDVEMLVAAI